MLPLNVTEMKNICSVYIYLGHAFWPLWQCVVCCSGRRRWFESLWPVRVTGWRLLCLPSILRTFRRELQAPEQSFSPQLQTDELCLFSSVNLFPINDQVVLWGICSFSPWKEQFPWYVLCLALHHSPAELVYPSQQLSSHTAPCSLSAGMESRTERAEARKLVSWTKFRNRTEGKKNQTQEVMQHILQQADARPVPQECPSPFLPLPPVLSAEHGTSWPGMSLCSGQGSFLAVFPLGLLPWRRWIPASQAQCSNLGSDF